jgi:hypothetical protein
MQPSPSKNNPNALRDEIGGLLRKIEQLYEEIEKRNIEIPVKTRGKIQSVENEIIEEEIRSLKRIIRYYLIIISILEKLLKTPVLVIIFTAITSTVNSVFFAISRAFTSTGSKLKQAFRAVKDVIVRGTIAVKKGLKTEKVDRVPAVEARSTGTYDTVYDHKIVPPAEIVEDIKHHVIMPSGDAGPMDVSPQPIRAGTDSGPKTPEIAAKVVIDKKPELRENKQSYLKYAVLAIFLLVIGAALFMLIDNMKCSESVLPIKTYSCIDGMDMGKTTHAQLVEAINDRLKNMTYCCFKNMDTALESGSYESWKEKNMHFIQCITEHLPEGYVLVIKGHANKTGPEEDVEMFMEKENKPLKVLGNFSYSDGRAGAIMSELAREIPEDKVLFYGVGSREPRNDLPVAPEDDSNRRITFKVDKREILLKEKDGLRD